MEQVEKRENLEIRERLIALRDEENAAFLAKLIPNIDPGTILGVRFPALRKLARELIKTQDVSAFLDTLPHTYLEENHLHALLLEQEKDFDACMAAVERFLPYVDNWSTCDSLNPPVFQKQRPAFLERIRVWLKSEHPYTVRFAVKMLMNHFLDAYFRPEFLELVSVTESKEYYVNMMRAWYFATALAKQYDAAIACLEKGKLDPWTHNKSIQKAVESYRISPEQKTYLKTLKRK